MINAVDISEEVHKHCTREHHVSIHEPVSTIYADRINAIKGLNASPADVVSAINKAATNKGPRFVDVVIDYLRGHR